ncbi:hypothetical protein TrVFT333_008038 [Trichoderma virens FT-333]|nr:hypothetical protein TrVFT333_008038 [Trichoderma virens FT-333]
MAASAAVSAQEAQQMPFIKNLASSGPPQTPHPIPLLPPSIPLLPPLHHPLDARKLWTGLYYALWMTDRPRPQQALAADLANLVFDLQPACVEPWLAAFWSVLGVQWPHIEALRLDKFLLLVRRVFAAHVKLVREKGFQGDLAAQVVRVFAQWCFDAEDENKVALGLRLHAFVKEVGALVESLKRCPVKSVRQRALDSYDDERLPWVEKKEEDEDEEMDGAEDDEDDEWGGIDN